jgi:acetylornithine deacetylase/succinyl-diaminopimelate desuccinylase-like protein
MSVQIEEMKNLVSDLVRIDSSNPWLVPGSPGEAEVADFIAAWFKKYPVEIKLEEVEPGRPNLIVIWRGSGGGKSLCLYAHNDTVGYNLWRERALIPQIEGDRLIGLGGADDKGHGAAIMLALKSLIESGVSLRGDVWAFFPIDEEGTSSGSMDFVKRYKPDAVIVAEALEMGKVTVSHQGFGWIDIIIEGKAAHGSAPEVGVDAIAHMAEVITRLNKLNQEKFETTVHPLNGKTVFHTGTITGGTDYATYPDKCVLGIEIGTQPGETIQNRVDEIQGIFEEVRQLYPKFKGKVDVKLARDPFEAKDYEELWQIVSAEIEKETGLIPEAVGENSWGDAALFQSAGIPTLMFGAAGGNLHAPDEWVSLPELTSLANILAGIARRFCA